MWHAGVRRRRGEGGARLEQDVHALGYDDFRSMRPEKTRDLSVVCSAKSQSDGHALRLSFVEQLKEHFGDRLDWFGKGIRPVEDKWEALAPYRFHISLENTAERDYWTEKLADAYLGCAFPFYWGCTNLSEYFEDEAFRTIDPARPQWSIGVIETVIAEGITAERLDAVERARALVLDRYNFFPAIVSLLGRCADGHRQVVRLRPEAEFLPASPAVAPDGRSREAGLHPSRLVRRRPHLRRADRRSGPTTGTDKTMRRRREPSACVRIRAASRACFPRRPDRRAEAPTELVDEVFCLGRYAEDEVVNHRDVCSRAGLPKGLEHLHEGWPLLIEVRREETGVVDE